MGVLTIPQVFLLLTLFLPRDVVSHFLMTRTDLVTFRTPQKCPKAVQVYMEATLIPL